MSLTDQELAEKLRGAESAIAHQWGEFSLFGLFEREDTPGRWDVVVSAPWLTVDRAGIQKIVDGVRPFLPDSEWVRLARIVPLAPSEEFVQTLTRMFDGTLHMVAGTNAIVTAGIHINRAFIITANKRPAETVEVLAA